MSGALRFNVIAPARHDKTLLPQFLFIKFARSCTKRENSLRKHEKIFTRASRSLLLDDTLR